MPMMVVVMMMVRAVFALMIVHSGGRAFATVMIKGKHLLQEGARVGLTVGWRLRLGVCRRRRGKDYRLDRRYYF